MSQYAQLSDLTTYGLPATAIGNLTTAQQSAELVAASAEMDSYFAGRFRNEMPFAAWGVEVTRACCRIAAWNLLSIRGFNPASGADQAVRTRYNDTITWLRQVQNGQAHPNVTPQIALNSTDQQPSIISSSVVTLDSTATTAPNRGW